MSSFGRRPGRLRTVLLHPSGGGLGQYMAVISHLSRRGPVHGIRAAGLQPGETPDNSVETMLQRYLPLLRALPGPPDLLLGWSLGGVLAWELAVASADTGHRPAVVMVDSFAEPWSACHTDPQKVLDRILSQSSSPEPAARDRLERTAAAHLKASSRHHASRHYDGPVLLMSCAGAEREAQVAAWTHRSPRLVTRDLPCGHFDVFQSGPRRLMTHHLDTFLSRLPHPSRPNDESRLSGAAGTRTAPPVRGVPMTRQPDRTRTRERA